MGIAANRNNYILIVFDSCRSDLFLKARPKIMAKLGPVQKRWAYTSWTPPEPLDQWLRISSVHGVFKPLDDHLVGGRLRHSQGKIFNQGKLKELRNRQVEAVKYLNGAIEELFDVLPANTFLTITSDHGELFGEDEFFGHGPVRHDKVLQVPFVEGQLR